MKCTIQLKHDNALLIKFRIAFSNLELMEARNIKTQRLGET